MGTMKLQVSMNTQNMVDLGLIKKARNVPSNPKSPGYVSDDVFARGLLLEKIAEELTSGSKTRVSKN